MISEKILNLTDLLAESLIVSDLNDLQEVGKIYDLYLKINEEAKKSDMSDVAQICDDSIDLVKQVMMDDNANKEEILQKLNDSISKIQYVSRSGYQDRVDLPKETVPASNSSSETLNKSKIKFQLPEIVDEDIFNDFLSEQNSVLDNIETLLLSLETEKDKETLNNLRRVFHTLKGESAVFGLNDIARICHLAEDLTETPDIELPIDKLLTVKDWFKDVFDALKANEQMPELDDTLLELFQMEIDKSVSVEAVAEKSVKEETEKEQTSDTGKDESLSKSTDKIIAGDIDLITDFVAEAQEHIDNIDSKLLTLETDPEDAEILNAVFRVFHTLKGAARFLALDDIAKLAHTTENLLDLARKRDLVLTGNKIDVVFEAVDQMNKLVANIRDVLSGGLTEYPIDPNLDILIEKIKKVIAGDDLESEPSPVKDTINEMTPASEEVTENKLTNKEEVQPEEENNKKKPSETLETKPSVKNTPDKTKLSKVKIKEANELPRSRAARYPYYAKSSNSFNCPRYICL